MNVIVSKTLDLNLSDSLEHNESAVETTIMCEVCLEGVGGRTKYFSTSACNHRKMCITCAKEFFTSKVI